MPEENTPQVDPNTEHLKNLTDIGEHNLMQGADHVQATKNLETPLEGILLKSDEIAKNTKPKEVQDVRIKGFDAGPVDPDEDGDDDSEEEDDSDEENDTPMPSVDDFQKSFWAMIRGPKGYTPKKGKDYFTDAEKKDMMAQMIPHVVTAATPVKGQDYMTEQEMSDLAQEVFGMVRVPEDGHTPVKGVDYKDGEPGESPTDEKLLELIESIMPPTVPGAKGEPGKDGRKITGAEIIAKIKGLLSYDDLKDLPNLDTFRRPSRTASKDYATSELTDVSMQNIAVGQMLQWDGHRFIPVTVSSSSGTQVFGEVIGSTGSAAFTLGHTPIAGTARIYRGGAYQQAGAGNDYTLAAANGTLSSVLQNGEVLLADYNY